MIADVCQAWGREQGKLDVLQSLDGWLVTSYDAESR